MPAFTIELPNGKRMDVEAADENAALEGAKTWYSQNVSTPQPPAHEGDMLDAVGKGLSDVVSGVGSTLKNYGAPEAGKAIESTGAGMAPTNYKSATDAFMHPTDGGTFGSGYDLTQVPRAAVESIPGLAADVGAALLAKRLKLGKAGIVGAGAGSHMLRTTGKNAEERAEYRTGEKGAEPNTSDKTYGAGSAAIQSAINQLGVGRFVNPGRLSGTGLAGVADAGRRLATTAGIEGATEGVQDVVGQVGSTINTPRGLDVSAHQAVGSGILGAATGGGMAAPRAGRDALTAARFRKEGEHSEASTAVANRLVERAGSVDALGDRKGAYTALTDVSSDVSNELAQAAKAAALQSPEASNALKRVSSGKRLNDDDFATIDAAGDTALSNIVRQAHVLATLRRKGVIDEQSETYGGGLTERIRRFGSRRWPWIASVAGAGGAVSAYKNGAVGLDTLMAATPTIAAAGLGLGAAYGGLHAAEGAMGIRAPARTFADTFADPTQEVRTPAPPAPEVVRPTTVPSVAQFAGPWGHSPTKEAVAREKRLEADKAKGVKQAAKDAFNSLHREDAQQRKAAKDMAKSESLIDTGISDIVSNIGQRRDQEFSDAMKGGRSLMRGITLVDKMRREHEALNTPKADPEEDPFKQARAVVKARNWADKMRADYEAQNAPKALAPVDPIVATKKLMDSLAYRDKMRTTHEAAERQSAPEETVKAGKAIMDARARVLRLREKHEKAEAAKAKAVAAKAKADAATPRAPRVPAAPKTVPKDDADAEVPKVEKPKAAKPEAEKPKAPSAKVARTVLAAKAAADAKVSKTPAKRDDDPAEPAPKKSVAQQVAEMHRRIVERAAAEGRKPGDPPKPRKAETEVPTDEFKLPEVDYADLDPKSAAKVILQRAIEDGKNIRNREGYRAATARRLQGQQEIHSTISASMKAAEDKQAARKYLSALWGSDSPEAAKQVREHMKVEFPEHAEMIDTHLNDKDIEDLWTQQRKK